MATFTTVSGIRDNMLAANNILNTLQVIYTQCNTAKAILARYLSDPAFKAEADHLFTPAQLAELDAMIADTSALATAWTANHKSALGLE